MPYRDDPPRTSRVGAVVRPTKRSTSTRLNMQMSHCQDVGEGLGAARRLSPPTVAGARAPLVRASRVARRALGG